MFREVGIQEWPTAKLHRLTVICFFSFISLLLLISVLILGTISPLSSAGFPFPVATSDLSAPKKCRARFGLDQQNNWCGPCRCVWCVLALARARWRLGNRMLGLPPFAPLACAFFFYFPFVFISPFSFLFLPVCPTRLSRPLSFLQPRPAGLSLGSPPIWFLPLFLGWRVLTAFGRVFVWMVTVCVCRGGYRGFIAGWTVQWASLRLVRDPKLAGRGLEDLEAWWLGPYGGTSQCCQPEPKPWLHVFVCAMTCPFSFFFLFFCLLSVCLLSTSLANRCKYPKEVSCLVRAWPAEFMVQTVQV